MLSEHFSQRRMQQVRGGVVAHRVDAHGRVDLGRHLLPGLQGPAAYPAQVHVGISLLLRVFDGKYAGLRNQFAPVSDLAAGFRVERGLIKHNAAGLVFFNTLDYLVVLQQGRYPPGDAQGIVSFETGGVALQVGKCGDVRGKPVRLPRPLALLLHTLLKPFQVQFQAALAGNIRGEVNGEPVSIIQLEHDFARDSAGGKRADRGFQVFKSLLQGFRKPFFLLLQGIGHEFPCPAQFRAGFSHDGVQGTHQLMEERLIQAQLGPVAQCPADDSAQHVAPSLVGRDNAVCHQERAGTDMVGDHPG